MSCLTRHLQIQQDILNTMESDKMGYQPRKPNNPPPPLKPSIIYSLITIKCINCGAENSFKTRSAECEYCRTVLYRELPDVQVLGGAIEVEGELEIYQNYIIVESITF